MSNRETVYCGSCCCGVAAAGKPYCAISLAVKHKKNLSNCSNQMAPTTLDKFDKNEFRRLTNLIIVTLGGSHL